MIDEKLCAVHYASFDSAVDLVVRAGVDAWLAKTDIKSAFRLLPVSPTDYELLGFIFDGSFYYDKCLPMGCFIACSMFEKFSTFLEFQFKKVTGCSLVTHYLDDFLFVAPSAHSCAHLLDMFTSLCEEVGVPLAPEKTMGPAQVIKYLGLEIDTLQGQVKVPEDKVQAISKQIHAALSCRKMTMVGIQSWWALLTLFVEQFPLGGLS